MDEIQADLTPIEPRAAMKLLLANRATIYGEREDGKLVAICNIDTSTTPPGALPKGAHGRSREWFDAAGFFADVAPAATGEEVPRG